MIHEFKCSGYRGLGDFQIENPGRFNLLVGPNNSGKTSVLEALHIACSSDIPKSFGKNMAIRLGKDTLDINPIALFNESFERMKWNFSKNRFEMYFFIQGPYDSDFSVKNNSKDEITQKITLELIDDKTLPSNSKLKLKRTEKLLSTIFEETLYEAEEIWNRLAMNIKPVFPALFLHSSSHKNYNTIIAFNKVLNAGKEEYVTKKIKELDEDIESIRIAIENNIETKPVIHLKHNKLISSPLYNFGDGVQKAFEYASRLLEIEKGVLLIDELETSLHPQALQSLFKWLLDLVEELDIQVFATTHSMECIDALMDSLPEGDQRVVLYRLKKMNDNVNAVRFDADEIRYSRKEIGTDLRYSL